VAAHKQALEHWLKGRVERWKWLDSRCKGAGKNDPDSGKEDVEFDYLTSLSIRCREEIYTEPGSLWHSLKRTALRTVPKVIRELRSVIISTILLFMLSVFCGWWLVNTFPELVSLFASRKMIDTVQSGE